ncbi:N,N-dimethylformamidase beta subunit family domain-containing protein [Arthrobacter sp. AQ5-05]|uniref:N,N-dimethylformamidase beta subunit family domain-containing protein n=1 Tax=Arthrobacter sp. AQ5-05 TaxID=2184581 RepID=UPI0018A73496|nr:N,N-dimethylformamidase beta subunit family domain-containing protein [Arthrobacter sp. AQ5-05]
MYGDLKVKGTFTVSDPTFFAFAGTGAKKDYTFAGLVGGETDFVYGKDQAVQVENPDGLHIFAHSLAAGAHNQHGWADSTFYATASGESAINMGPMDWLQAMADPGVPEKSRSFALHVIQNTIPESGRNHIGAPAH